MTGIERGSFYRERASQAYNALWYGVGGLLAEIPYIAFSTLTMVAIFFPMANFSGFGEFSLYWLHTTLFALEMTYAGMFLAYALPSIEVATALGTLLNSILFLFVGFNPPASSIPTAYNWLYQIAPMRYALEALTVTVFGNCKRSKPESTACIVMQNPPPIRSWGVTIAQYVEEAYQMRYGHLWRNSSSCSASCSSSPRWECSRFATSTTRSVRTCCSFQHCCMFDLVMWPHW